MDIEGRKRSRNRKRGFKARRVLALLLGICLIVCGPNLGSLFILASEDDAGIIHTEEKETGTSTKTQEKESVESAQTEIQVGETVSATLSGGILTLSGKGRTRDFTEETAPFLSWAESARSLVIEDGITYIGAFLFYGLGNLRGELNLPGSIGGYGEYAFSGADLESAPGFDTVRNECINIQQADSPETLFHEGQTGTYFCTVENESFLTAVTHAGYKAAEDFEKENESDLLETGMPEDGEVFPEPYLLRASEGDGINMVYVDKTSGDDKNGGTAPENAVKTLKAADKLLKAKEDGGTADNNIIVICGQYQMTSEEEQSGLPQNPVTIKGNAASDGLVGSSTNAEQVMINLRNTLKLDDITLKYISHVYANGYDLTIGYNVSANGLYLYGAGRTEITEVDGVRRVGKISVYSGSFSRIASYVRSAGGSIDADGINQAQIVVGGSAKVSMILGGIADGSVLNGNVQFNIEGGVVQQIVGGNQGYNSNKASFQGRTEINISGGTVENCYSAGSGRSASVPEYCGNLIVNVSGGAVTNLYGAGSAAYITPNGAEGSLDVDISITGGKVKNIYAAGRGGDGALNSNASGIGTDVQAKMGSLTGNAQIRVSGTSTEIGNIYASGQGYKDASDNPYTDEGAKGNAYLEGNVVIEVSGGIVTGNIYGGGAGIDKTGYENCAGVRAGSNVTISVGGGTVQGNVFGGGQFATVNSDTSVTLSGGSIYGNVYGGGERGSVAGKTEVNISGGTVNHNVYGGALGIEGKTLVMGQSTINMSGGAVEGSLYGGSEQSDNGPEGAVADLIFVNLTGGTVKGNVFGGGYQGKVNGSTHLHIGVEALDECKYYGSHREEQPLLPASVLSINGSAYAGGDYGNADYNTITVSGTSHVYIAGEGYDTGGGGGPEMDIAGGVFGSGATCDAGSSRIVTLDGYGKRTAAEDGTTNGATRVLAAIQRADRVILKDSHVKLTGQSDVANADQTAKYSLNRIGDHGDSAALEPLGNGLILQGGSTLVLNSSVLEIANYKSVDNSGNEVGLNSLTASGLDAEMENTILFSSGTVFRIAYTGGDGSEIFGGVQGYTYMAADNTAVAYAYARILDSDGGFVAPHDTAAMDYIEVGTEYRYWRIAGEQAGAAREAVLTAKELDSGDEGYGIDGYSVVGGEIELPEAEAGDEYTIKSVTLPGGITLVDAAKSGLSGSWALSEANQSEGTEIDEAEQKTAIDRRPLSTFGMYMEFGSGFQEDGKKAGGKVISAQSAQTGGVNSIIGQKVTYTGNTAPKINFYLTYKNNGITSSQDLGPVKVEMVRVQDGIEQETTTIEVEIITRASRLFDQTLDLYATQNGNYIAKLIIPAGAGRELSLTGVETAADSSLSRYSDTLAGEQFAVTMLPEQGKGWSSGLMESAYDLKDFTGGSIAIGSTDSRFEAGIIFTMYNAKGFAEAKEEERIALTLHDGSNNTDFTITLCIRWMDSIVSAVELMQGKGYNGSSAAGSSVDDGGSVTAKYTLLTEATEQSSDLWLELETGNGGASELPVGTKLTLLRGNSFYSYQLTGKEEKNRIRLSEFREMWKETPFNNVSSGEIRIIVDFSDSAMMPAGDYSLRLKSEKGADSIGADFTMGGSKASAALTGGNGLSRGGHIFNLDVSAGNDTRFSERMAVVLSDGDGKGFPEGTVFEYGGENYYPVDGKVYLILQNTASHTIVMNTAGTAGLEPGEHKLEARVFPVGIQAGGIRVTDVISQTVYTVSGNASYSLGISLSEGSRMTEAGKTLSFSAEYMVSGTDNAALTVGIQKKNGGTYEEAGEAAGWVITGAGETSGIFGTQSILITVPMNVEAGTYRINFVLGNQTIPYNIIVHGKQS
ncbi:hypothetical protein LQE92_11530 [Lacrimispora sp. NSJ-141]|uniref:Uncharacterized protein n=1 Tax=Lientehia hominis TaxID=2897778 RepID=A0AAP2RKD3_9FIRM|nr:hypothetical protein [Lientehia hominis]MCD2493250.1 hypothetical protein [Lientehia hominis]